VVFRWKWRFDRRFLLQLRLRATLISMHANHLHGQLLPLPSVLVVGHAIRRNGIQYSGNYVQPEYMTAIEGFSFCLPH